MFEPNISVLLKVLEKLNNLSAQELSKFKTFGIDKAQRLVSYREEKGMLTSFQDLKDINGFTDALINSIEREGLMLKKKQGYNNLLDASTAKVCVYTNKIFVLFK